MNKKQSKDCFLLWVEKTSTLLYDLAVGAAMKVVSWIIIACVAAEITAGSWPFASGSITKRAAVVLLGTIVIGFGILGLTILACIS
jgi:hypothetical protein